MRDLSTHFRWVWELLGQRVGMCWKCFHRYGQFPKLTVLIYTPPSTVRKFQVPLSVICVVNIHSSVGCLFTLLMAYNSISSTYQSFLLWLRMFLYSWRNTPTPKSWRYSIFFSSRNSFRSMIHFHTFICRSTIHLIHFVYSVKCGSWFISAI